MLNVGMSCQIAEVIVRENDSLSIKNDIVAVVTL